MLYLNWDKEINISLFFCDVFVWKWGSEPRTSSRCYHELMGHIIMGMIWQIFPANIARAISFGTKLTYWLGFIKLLTVVVVYKKKITN